MRLDGQIVSALEESHNVRSKLAAPMVIEQLNKPTRREVIVFHAASSHACN